MRVAQDQAGTWSGRALVYSAKRFEFFQWLDLSGISFQGQVLRDWVMLYFGSDLLSKL